MATTVQSDEQLVKIGLAFVDAEERVQELGSEINKFVESFFPGGYEAFNSAVCQAISREEAVA